MKSNTLSSLRIKTFIIVLTLSFSVETWNCLAQITTFHKVYKSDISYSDGALTAPYDVLQIYGGGYVMIGQSENYGTPLQIDVVKTDNLGTTVWEKRINLQNSGHLASIRQTSDSGYIITGDGNGNIFLLKLDKTGNVSWIKSYDGSTLGHYAQQTQDGGYVIIGNSLSGNIHLIKTDASGSLLWSKTYGGSGGGAEEGWDIKETADGYIILGSTKGNFNLKWMNIYLIKIDKKGTVLWTKIHGNNTDDFWGYSIQQTLDKGYIIAGFTEPILNFDSINNNVTVGDWDMFLMKTDTNGNAEWTKSFQNTNTLALDDYAYEVEQTKDSGFVFVGKSYDDSFYSDISLVKINSKGKVVWSKAYGDITQQLYIAQASSMQKTQDGGFIISGITREFSTQQNFLYLIKTDEAGNTGCRQVDLPLKDSTWNLNTISGCVTGYGGNELTSAFSMGTLSITDSSLCSCTLPTLTLTSDNSICGGDTATFTVQGADTYTWSPSTYLSSATDSTVKAFPPTTTSYTVVGTNGCGNKSSTVTLIVNPLPAINFGKDTTLCQGNTLLLNAGNVGANYLWQDGSANQTYTASVSGTFYVTVTNNNCTANDTINVTINPLPVVNFGNDTTLCQGNTLLLNAGNAGADYLWQDGSASQTYTAANSGTFYVTVTNANNCTANDTIGITINALPVINLGNDTVICQGNTLLLNAGNLGADYLWQDGSTNPTYNTSISGTYHVAVTNSCGTSTDSVSVTAYSLPVVFAGTDTSISSGNSIALAAIGATDFIWIPTMDLNCTNCYNPIASPQITTTYYVTGTDNNGCSATDSVTVYVTPINCGEIFIPDAFSPNEDNNNDELKVYGNCIKSLTFTIYDRWGEKVFETENVQQGWNGIFNGRQMNTGTFVYHLKATLITDEEVERKGNVSLMR